MVDAASLIVGELLDGGGGGSRPPNASTTPMGLEAELEHDATVVSMSMHDFFADFIPVVGKFLLIALFISAAILIIVSACRFQMHRSGTRPNCNRIVQYVIVIVLTVVGFSAALGLVGVELTSVVFTLGLFGIAFSAGCSQTISNMSAGIFNQLEDDLVEEFSELTLPAYQARGRVVSMNMLRVLILSDDGQSITHVPNALLASTVYSTRPLQARPGHAIQAVPSMSRRRHRAIAQAKRNGDRSVDALTKSVQTNGRDFFSLVTSSDDDDGNVRMTVEEAMQFV